MIGPVSGTSRTGSRQPATTTASPTKPATNSRDCWSSSRVHPPLPSVSATWIDRLGEQAGLRTARGQPRDPGAVGARLAAAGRARPELDALAAVHVGEADAALEPPGVGDQQPVVERQHGGDADLLLALDRRPVAVGLDVRRAVDVRDPRRRPPLAAGQREQEGEAGDGPHVEMTRVRWVRLTKHRRGVPCRLPQTSSTTEQSMPSRRLRRRASGDPVPECSVSETCASRGRFTRRGGRPGTS